MKFFRTRNAPGVIDRTVAELAAKQERHDRHVADLIEERDRINLLIIEHGAASAGIAEALMSLRMARDVEPLLLEAAE